MQHIIEGFLSFQKEIFPQRKELFRSLASSQNPKALFISCSDSRLVPELVTQQEPDSSLSFETRATLCLRSGRSLAVSLRPSNMLLLPGRDRYRYLRPLKLRRNEGDC